MIYSDFRKITKTRSIIQQNIFQDPTKSGQAKINFYGTLFDLDNSENHTQVLDIFRDFQENIDSCLNYFDDHEAAQQKDLDFLLHHAKQLKVVTDKYDMISAFVSTSQERFQKDLDQVNGEWLFDIQDSYSGKDVIDNSMKDWHMSFLVDKLSFRFNLACCYSRMPSRLDVNWSPGYDEKGIHQAAQMYIKSAEEYQKIIVELQEVKNISKNEDNQFWSYLSRKILGADLQIETLKMLNKVMIAQAQYLVYNNVQQKLLKRYIKDDDGQIVYYISGLTSQISDYFKEAYQFSQKNQSVQIFKQRDMLQSSEIYYNSKRFQLFSIQTLAKYYHSKKDYVNSYVTAYLAYQWPIDLQMNDPVYTQVHDLNTKKQSNEVKSKYDLRNKEMQDIMNTVQNSHKEIVENFNIMLKNHKNVSALDQTKQIYDKLKASPIELFKVNMTRNNLFKDQYLKLLQFTQNQATVKMYQDRQSMLENEDFKVLDNQAVTKSQALQETLTKVKENCGDTQVLVSKSDGEIKQMFAIPNFMNEIANISFERQISAYRALRESLYNLIKQNTEYHEQLAQIITKQEGLIQEEFFQDKKIREYLVENMNKNQPIYQQAVGYINNLDQNLEEHIKQFGQFKVKAENMKKSIDKTIIKEKDNFRRCQALAERVRSQQSNLRETKFKLILKLKLIIQEDKQLGLENKEQKQFKSGIDFYKLLLNNEIDPYPKMDNIQLVLQNQTEFLVDLRNEEEFSNLVSELKNEATKEQKKSILLQKAEEFVTQRQQLNQVLQTINQDFYSIINDINVIQEEQQQLCKTHFTSLSQQVQLYITQTYLNGRVSRDMMRKDILQQIKDVAGGSDDQYVKMQKLDEQSGQSMKFSQTFCDKLFNSMNESMYQGANKKQPMALSREDFK